MMRACLVGTVGGLDDARADRAGDLGLLVFRAAERVAAFGLDLVVMGSSQVHAAPFAAPPQPRPANHRRGKIPRRALVAPSHHNNAPIKPESHSILSKKIAQLLGANAYQTDAPIWHAWPHCEPRDRPMDVFGGVTSLHFGAGRQPHLLLPIIPPKKGAAQKRGEPPQLAQPRSPPAHRRLDQVAETAGPRSRHRILN
jgi:hypothetical protein